MFTRRAAGLARLEFALSVAVAGAIAALALSRIAELQVSAESVKAQTLSAQAQSATALSHARTGAPREPMAATPCPSFTTSASHAGSLPGSPYRSCP